MTTPRAFNPAFQWQPAGAASSPHYRSARQIDRFNHDGYCLVENASSTDTVGALTAAIDAWESRATDFLRTQPMNSCSSRRPMRSRSRCIWSRGTIRAAPFLVMKRCSVLPRHLIGHDVSMDGDQAVYKKPEPLREFPWRQDDGYAFVEPQQYLTCWVPGTDSVLSSLTPHRTGPNITNHVRKAYILQYAPTGTVVKHGPNPRDKMSAYDPDRQYEVLRIGIAVH